MSSQKYSWSQETIVVVISKTCYKFDSNKLQQTGWSITNQLSDFTSPM